MSSSDEFRVVEASYVLSAPSLAFCPPVEGVEFAIAGRSNVGKSSLINALCNRRSLAKTSNTPGKTRAINYFNLRIEPHSLVFHLVDLPGYGYAKVSKKEQQDWGEKLNEYLYKREPLIGVIHLIDARHAPTSQDVQMREWILESRLTPITVFTKADKLGRTKLAASMKRMEELLLFKDEEIRICTSAVKKEGVAELASALAGLLMQRDGASVSDPGQE